MAEQQQQQQQQPQTAPRGRVQDKAALQQSNLKQLRDMLNKMSKQLEHALPSFLTPERMIRVATTTVQKNPRLLECAPVTVVGAIMQAAALGLEPDNVTGSAYLVPFWSTKMRRLECTLIPGYRGLMALARRSKEVAAFDARVVKAGDLFDFEYGTKHFLRHKPAMGMSQKNGVWQLPAADTPEPDTIAAYMVAYYGKGADLSQFHVMLRRELDQARQFTTSKDKEGNVTGPWIEHPDAMRTKTVIRRGCKLLPFSIELMTAVGLEERAIAGKSQNLGALVADDLGIAFAADDDAETDTGDGTGAEAPPDPELTAKIEAGFQALEFNEGRKTAKYQEFRGRLPELLQWLEAEALKHAKPAGEGSTVQNRGEGPVERATNDGSIGTGPDRNANIDQPRKPRASGRFKI